MSQARKYLANNLKKFRTEKNYKREQLSLLLGFDNSYISKLEQGNINITLDRLELIANALEIEVAELLKKNS